MRSRDLITLNESKSMVAESYRMFRTNLNYVNVDKRNQVLLFTSSLTEEGKTTTIANTAITFAMDGHKTCLIECDLRKARVHDVFALERNKGLTNILTEQIPFLEVIQPIEECPGLDVITAGPLPPSPSELLGSKRIEVLMDELRMTYDKILIDAPPILSVTDALVLNRLVDGVILVVAANETKKETVRKSLKALSKVEANLIGTLISKMDVKRNGYYSYYKYGYTYGEDTKKQRKKRDKLKKRKEKEIAKYETQLRKKSHKEQARNNKALDQL